MSTPFPSQLPADLQKVIDGYVAAKISELAIAANLANAPAKVLSPHESLLDHVARANVALNGDSGQIAAFKVNFHVLEALALLIKEVEDSSTTATPVAAPSSAASTAPVVTPASVDTSSATTVVTEGAI